jgi:hypothetical protein
LVESVVVDLDRPPHSARLYVWGRWTGGWWGAVSLRQPVVTAAGLADYLVVAAWVPGTSVKRPGWSKGSLRIPRIELPVEQRDWPAPELAPVWFVGVWVGGPLVLPPGLTADTRPRWRR